MGGLGDFLSSSHLSDYFKEIDFPATKQDLVNYAEDHHAPQKIIEMVDKLPDKTYNSMADVIGSAAKAAF